MDIASQELLEVSTELEEKVQELYRNVAGRIDDPVVKNYLLLMARDEAHHEKHFEDMLGTEESRHCAWNHSPKLRELIDTQIQKKLFPMVDHMLDRMHDSVDIPKALEVCLKCEEMSVEFYGLMRASCEDVETKSVLIELESEEKSHRDFIRALLQHWEERFG
ncbi:ferritin-like domain-containing protein [Nitrospina sp. 32_T5]|uniref:ferritin-like domain-containing protein n=1 Tax=unclassified Nitrospina TaxID=2638683 RepID=UPI003F98D14B